MSKYFTPSKHFLIISFTIILLAVISIYFNIKSLKHVLNMPIPKESITFNESSLINAIQKTIPIDKVSTSQKPADIKVLAIAYSNNPAYSMVLIDSTCGKKILLEDESFCQITIKDIKPLYILALQNGNTIKLKLSKGGISTKNNNHMSGLPSLQQLLKGSSSNTYIIPRNKLLQITSNPSKMFSDIDLVPTAKGFMFKSVKTGSLFYDMGLRAGDVLLSINGQALNSPEDAFRILETIRNSDSFSANIIRNNQNITLNYKVR